MKNDKINCWEFFKCGREEGGKNAKSQGVCPATVQSLFNGFNEGKNSGRACWLVAGTFCNKIVQGTFARKKNNCMECEFYQKVHLEMGISNLETESAKVFGCTHVGNKRKSNEDRYFLRDNKNNEILIAIADGMGGEVAGDFAAEITSGELSSFGKIEKGKEEESLLKLAENIDSNLASIAEQDPEFEGMGTTLITVLIRGGIAYWAHVGDSRLYHYRDKKIKALTEDQNFAGFLLAEGEITKEEFETHASKNLLDQCIGCGFVEPETGSVKLEKNDHLILTTDGFHGYFQDDEFERMLQKEETLEKKSISLIEAALGAGGEDNITVILAEYTGIQE